MRESAIETLYDTLWTLLPLAVLFGIFMIGFGYAWTDFKPRMISEKESERFSSGSVLAEPVVRQRELTMRDLGLEDLNNPASRSFFDQKRGKIRDVVRNYATESPETAAEVIRNWLREDR